jgi:hypothetical protein
MSPPFSDFEEYAKEETSMTQIARETLHIRTARRVAEF